MGVGEWGLVGWKTQVGGAKNHSESERNETKRDEPKCQRAKPENCVEI